MLRGVYVINKSTRKYDVKNTQIPGYRPLPKYGEFIQILNWQTRKHWICIAANCKPEKIIRIHVYDSLNTNTVNHELVSQVSAFFKCHESLEFFEFVFHKVTYQLDNSSCGVHAIANAIVLCRDELPEWHYYTHKEMRKHLVSIIENGNNVEAFPSTMVPCNLPEPSIRFRPVFCYCRQADDGSDMYQCSRHVFYESI